MGRKAGVTAEETRTSLLEAAAEVFAQSGYDGASISTITARAGLSSGTVYAHYASKLELFLAVLDAHGMGEIETLLGSLDHRGVTDYYTARGSMADQRDPEFVSLLVEAIVASKRDDEVANQLRPEFVRREAHMASLLAEAQRDGLIDDAIGPEVMARFATMVGLGSLLAGALQMPAVDHDQWGAMIARVVGSVRLDEAERASVNGAAPSTGRRT